MSQHRVTVAWRSGTAEFGYETYSRDHTWCFEGGPRIDASAAPEFLGTAGRVDPEEAFVAALSSCHMLSFLAIAARKRLPVASYRDAAVGTLEKNAEGRLAVTRVLLRPQVEFEAGAAPAPEQLERMHRLAHRECFIANSVRTEIEVVPAPA